MIVSLNIVRIKNENDTKNNTVTPDQLNNITNNYVKQIECLCLDEFVLQDRLQILNNMVQKLCLGGTISLKFINLNLLSNKINKSELTGEKYSSILPALQSCWSDSESMEIIQKMPVIIKGLYYDNIYTIVNLEKVS